MKFKKLDLDSIIGQIGELCSDSMDDQGRALVEEVHRSTGRLRKSRREVTADDVEESLRDNVFFLDVCRLFLGVAQEPAAHKLCASLAINSCSFSRLRSLAKQDPKRMATALADIGVLDVINAEIGKKWRVEDVLLERYKMSRGRAIAGQKRGRGLEEDVECVLKEIGAPYEVRVTFVGQKGTKAKCDFAIPTRDTPKIVIEAKGFEATGSKLTDFLGDVLKIGQAKAYHMYVFVVTDGRGWHNRRSDLQKLVEYQNEGLIDMIYTCSTLPFLAKDIKQIIENE